MEIPTGFSPATVSESEVPWLPRFSAVAESCGDSAGFRHTNVAREDGRGLIGRVCRLRLVVKLFTGLEGSRLFRYPRHAGVRDEDGPPV